MGGRGGRSIDASFVGMLRRTTSITATLTAAAARTIAAIKNRFTSRPSRGRDHKREFTGGSSKP